MSIQSTPDWTGYSTPILARWVEITTWSTCIAGTSWRSGCICTWSNIRLYIWSTPHRTCYSIHFMTWLVKVSTWSTCITRTSGGSKFTVIWPTPYWTAHSTLVWRTGWQSVKASTRSTCSTGTPGRSQWVNMCLCTCKVISFVFEQCFWTYFLSKMKCKPQNPLNKKYTSQTLIILYLGITITHITK